jgi:hypothetical protein
MEEKEWSVFLNNKELSPEELDFIHKELPVFDDCETIGEVYQKSQTYFRFKHPNAIMNLIAEIDFLKDLKDLEGDLKTLFDFLELTLQKEYLHNEGKSNKQVLFEQNRKNMNILKDKDINILSAY